MALDHFLLGELNRLKTWDESGALYDDSVRVTYYQHLEAAVDQFRRAIEMQADHYWSHLQLGRC